MKKVTIILISFLLSFGFAIHIEAQSLTEQQAKLLKNEVDAIFQEMLISAEKLDYDKLSLVLTIHTEQDLLPTGNIILNIHF
jgi:hypothetical protein